MKPLELFARATGLKIGKQSLNETFFPLPFTRYITLQSGSGMASKNYPHYNEVVALIRPILAAHNITIVQVGGKEDAPIPGCYYVQGATTLSQCNYVLTRSMLHLGNDSWMAHRIGELGLPLITLFGATSAANHSAYHFNKKVTTFIEAHRWGRKPTFALQEHPQTIATIPPEEAANHVLRLLGFSDVITRQSLMIGTSYNEPMLELVPNVVVAPNIQVPGALIVRMDYEFNESVLAQNLQIRKCAIITDREIDLNLLAALKPQISIIRAELDNLSPEWIQGVKKIGLTITPFTTEKDEKKLKAMRLRFFDACLFDTYTYPVVADFRAQVKTYLNKDLDTSIKLDTLSFKTNKFLLSGGKVYLSKAHLDIGQATDTTDNNVGSVIDSDLFWTEQPHFYIFKS